MGNQISELKRDFIATKKEEYRSQAQLDEVKSKTVNHGEQKTGFERIKKFYDLDTVSMERYMVSEGSRMTFLTTFIIGGLMSWKEIDRRVQVYSEGKNFGSPRNKIVRQTDLKLLQFMKNGFKYSFKCVFVTASVLLANTHLILYKNRFEYWYPPFATGASSFILHGASVTGAFALPLGIHGCVQACFLGITGGSVISTTVFLYSLYRNSESGDAAYKDFRSGVERELDDHQQHLTRVRNLMKSEGISTRIMAEFKLKKDDDAAKISSGLENISDED